MIFVTGDDEDEGEAMGLAVDAASLPVPLVMDAWLAWNPPVCESLTDAGVRCLATREEDEEDDDGVVAAPAADAERTE